MGPLEFPAWDPVLVDLPGPFDLRFYGLMFVVGFVAARYLLRLLARRKFLPIEPPQVDDLIFCSVIGTVLGGRLGYAVFYDHALLNPLRFIEVWHGGLSFHGGLLGVVAAQALFAWRRHVSIGRVLDAAALAVTPGIFAVRCANFVNGELYGRTTAPDTPFAMQFPTDPEAIRALGLDRVPGALKRDVELAIQYAYRKPGYEWEAIRPELHDQDGFGHPIPWDDLRASLDWETARRLVPFRFPSQLFEAVGEGLVLGVLLWAFYWLTRRRPWPSWSYGGLFALGYGAVRFVIEYFRKPDQQFLEGGRDGTVLFGMTMGQTLCSVMVIVGAALLASGFSRRQRGEEAK